MHRVCGVGKGDYFWGVAFLFGYGLSFRGGVYSRCMVFFEWSREFLWPWGMVFLFEGAIGEGIFFTSWDTHQRSKVIGVL